MAVLRSQINPNDEQFRANQAAMAAQVGDLNRLIGDIKQGGGAEARKKHLDRGKLLPRDRIHRLVDPGSPFLEFSALAAHKVYDDHIPAAGIITGI